MTKITIYKIEDTKKDAFVKNLMDNSYKCSDEKKIFETNSNYFNHIGLFYSIEFYSNDSFNKKSLSWNWIREIFGLKLVSYTTNPSGILLINETKTHNTCCQIQVENNSYAISFGYAFHKIKDYADSSWALKIAERLNIELIKSMSLFSPNSIINRKVNNYDNVHDLLIDSGDALNKLDVDVVLGEDELKTFKNKIVVSKAIFFELNNPNLCDILNFIDYINYILSKNVKNRISYFEEIKSKLMKQELNKMLIDNIFEDIRQGTEDYCISIPEFILVDGSIKFLYEFKDFNLSYGVNQRKIDSLTIKEIYSFINDNLNENDNILEIKITFNEEESGNENYYKFKELITYDSRSTQKIFNEGSWFEYNNVYMDKLAKTLETIDIEYEDKYDFKESDYLDFLREKAHENNEDFDAMNEKQKTAFKRIWYKERVFNLLRVEDGFVCNDRHDDSIRGHKMEFADLFDVDEKSMYSVKIGSRTSNLNYVIDQSLIPLRMLDTGEINKLKNDAIGKIVKSDIKNVYLWLILDREALPLIDGKPDINSFNALIFKNRIVDWHNEVIKSKRIPKIKINYIDF